MRNIFSKSYWNRQVSWNKKQSWLCFLSTLTLFSFTIMLVTPAIFSDHHGDDGDWREEVAVILGGAGALIGAGAHAAGIVIAGGVAAATAPAWVSVATGVGIGLGAAAAGIAIWDVLDGPEDDCNDCDGSGYYMAGTHRCPTCNPPDDDPCPNCPGTGCSSCATEETCIICGETFYLGPSGSHTCPIPIDYTPDCPYCTAGCSSCSIGSGGSSGSYYDYP